MSRRDFRGFFQELAQRFLSHTFEDTDGFLERELAATETRLGFRMPSALRAYYLCAGRYAPFSSVHNVLRHPGELQLEQGYLVYMDENQYVVSWGLAGADCAMDDPVVWQRNNTPPEEWFSEEKTFSALMLDMFSWYDEVGVWTGLSGRR